MKARIFFALAALAFSTSVFAQGIGAPFPIAKQPVGRFMMTDADGAWRPVTLDGTADQVVVTPSSGSISLGLPQSIAATSSPTFASIKLTHGSAPGSPVNGQLWTTTAGLFVRINGATIGPLTAGGGGGGGNVSSSGTPVGGQLARWVSTTTIEGFDTLGVANGGTGQPTTTAYSVVLTGTTSTGNFKVDLGPGTSGYALTSNGPGAYPTWQAIPTGGGGGSGTVTHTVGALTSGYLTIGNGTDDIKVTGISVDGSNVMTLPAILKATAGIRVGDTTDGPTITTSGSSPSQDITITSSGLGSAKLSNSNGKAIVSADANGGDGRVKLYASSGDVAVRIQNASSGAYSSIDFLDDGGNVKANMGYANTGASVAPGKMLFYAPSGVGFRLYVSGAQALDIDTSQNATFAGTIAIATQSPASNGSGVAGTITWDSSFIYVCTATNTWKRAALTGGY